MAELRTHAPAVDTGAERDGSAAGALHRTWMDVKAFFSTDNDESMLEEAIRGDRAAVEEYDDLLEDSPLPMETANVVRRQRDQIEEDLRKIKSIEDLR